MYPEVSVVIIPILKNKVNGDGKKGQRNQVFRQLIYIKDQTRARDERTDDSDQTVLYPRQVFSLLAVQSLTV